MPLHRDANAEAEAEGEGEAGLTLFGAVRHHAPLARGTPLDQIALSIPPLPTPQPLPSFDEGDGGDDDVTAVQERGLLHGVRRLRPHLRVVGESEACKAEVLTMA